MYIYIYMCVFVDLFVQRNEFNSCYRMALFKNYLLLLTLASGDSKHGPTVFLPVLSFQSIANRFLNGCCPFNPLLSVFSTDADHFTCLALIFTSHGASGCPTFLRSWTGIL